MDFKPSSKNQKNPDSSQIVKIIIWISRLSTFEERDALSVTCKHNDGGWRSGVGWRVHDEQQSAVAWLFIYQWESPVRLSFSPAVARKRSEAKVKYYLNAVLLSRPVYLHAGLLAWPPPDWTNARPVNHLLGSSFTLRLIIIFSIRSWRELENPLIQ